MNPDLVAHVAPHLESGEEILWIGRPARGVPFRGVNLVRIPMIVCWCGAILFVGLSGLFKFPSGGALVMRVALVVGAIAVLFATFPLTIMRRRTTIYVLTNRRALCVSGKSGTTMEAFALSEPLFVVNPKVIFRNNVYFGCEQDDAMTQRSDLRRASKSWSFAVTPYVFQDIEDAPAVAELARGAQRKLKAAGVASA